VPPDDVIEVLPAEPAERDLAALRSLLRETVEAGASVGFVLPLGDDEVAAYWTGALAEVAAGERAVVVGRSGDDGAIVGAVHLALTTKPNGRHRAEVQKLMVRSGARRGGWGRRLMAAAEAEAARRGVRLLVLDTSEGPGGAVAFYEALGWTHVGGIPRYAVDPDGTPRTNAIFFKEL